MNPIKGIFTQVIIIISVVGFIIWLVNRSTKTPNIEVIVKDVESARQELKKEKNNPVEEIKPDSVETKTNEK